MHKISGIENSGLEISGLDAHADTTHAVRGAALTAKSGRITGLIGHNGAGKTTLMRAIMGLTRHQGRIVLDGTDLTGIPTWKRPSFGIGYMPEDRKLVPSLTARQNIEVPLIACGYTDIPERMEQIFGMIPECREYSDIPALSLSGGQQKLVALARALTTGTRLLLLDEPTEGVAPVLAKRLTETIKSISNEGPAILISESNPKHVAGLLDDTYIIERGTVRRSS